MTVIQIQSYVNLILSPLNLLVPNSIYGFVTLLQSHVLILLLIFNKFLISKYFISLSVFNSSAPQFDFTHFKFLGFSLLVYRTTHLPLMTLKLKLTISF